jgi:hypothetical protein
MPCTLCKVSLESSSQEYEANSACIMNGVEEECIQDIGNRAGRKDTARKGS